jgi:hypothetical protein
MLPPCLVAWETNKKHPLTQIWSRGVLCFCIKGLATGCPVFQYTVLELGNAIFDPASAHLFEVNKNQVLVTIFESEEIDLFG